MKKLLTVLLLIFSLYSLSSCKQDTLIVYTEAGFAPFEYVKDGKIVGVDVDIMNEVGKRINKKVVFENVSFVTPKGHYVVKLYEDYFRIQNKTYDFTF